MGCLRARRLVCLASAALAAGACEVAEQTDAEGVELAAAPLAADTAVAFFTLGRTRAFEPRGGYGQLAPGPPVRAALVLVDVPEGEQVVDYLGWARRAHAPPSPPSFPASAYCLEEEGATAFSVVSGRRSRASIRAAAVLGACQGLGLDRWILDAAYRSDPEATWFGADAGTNVATIFLDGWGAGAALALDVDAGASPAPLGLFHALPSPAERWPDVEAWNTGSLAVTADANGDAIAYAVAKPGATPVVWPIALERGATEVARTRVWIRGPRPPVGCPPEGCDDGVACTIDRCDALRSACVFEPDDAACEDGSPCTADTCALGGGCEHAPALEGTPCGTGGVCRSGACVVGLRAEAIEPTGWASSEGGFNANHAELRCGDDGRGGAGGYALQPGLTFDLSTVPAGATVSSAVLAIYQARVDGDAPFGPVMAEVVAEHVRYASMWLADEVPAIAGTIGQRVVSSTADPGWRSAVVTEAVAAELAAARTTVQLRLRFVPAMADGDAAIDWAVFLSDDAPAPNEALRPYLTIHTR